METKAVYEAPAVELVVLKFEVNILSGPYEIPGYGDSNEI